MTATLPTRVGRSPAPAAGPVRIGPGLALGAIGAGAVAVVALWWHDTLFVLSFGDWLTNAGRITGLLAGSRWWCCWR